MCVRMCVCLGSEQVPSGTVDVHGKTFTCDVNSSGNSRDGYTEGCPFIFPLDVFSCSKALFHYNQEAQIRV